MWAGDFVWDNCVSQSDLLEINMGISEILDADASLKVFECLLTTKHWIIVQR